MFLVHFVKTSGFGDGLSFAGVRTQSLYNTVHTEVASGMTKCRIVSKKIYQKS